VQKETMIAVIKRTLVALIVLATFTFFVFYLRAHPELLATLARLEPFTLLLLALGYILITLINASVLYYSLRFIGKRVPLLDNIVLTGYSSIVNFFGPLQSGPGFRAIYLKKRYGVARRGFFTTTLIFYVFFALINIVVLVFASSRALSDTLLFYILFGLGVAVLLTVVLIFINKVERVRYALRAVKLHDKNFWLIGAGAFALTLATAATYFIEIHHVDTSISAFQVITYTAAANLSLFVSLTPGAIGIRESFLVLSQQLHGIDTSVIVGASVIDRAFYVGFLAILFLALLLVNSRKRLAVFQLKKRE